MFNVDDDEDLVFHSPFNIIESYQHDGRVINNERLGNLVPYSHDLKSVELYC